MAEIKSAKKGAKKGFFEVKAPFTATKIQIYASNAEELNGKVIKLDLTRTLRGKSLELKMKIKLENGELVAEPISIELMGSYIRRMFRGGVDYVEDSFTVECKDAKVIIKPFMLTRNKVSRAVRRELRNTARKHLEVYLNTRTAKEVFTDITTNKIQRELSFKSKKIYPLALCEIRFFKILEQKK